MVNHSPMHIDSSAAMVFQWVLSVLALAAIMATLRTKMVLRSRGLATPWGAEPIKDFRRLRQLVDTTMDEDERRRLQRLQRFLQISVGAFLVLGPLYMLLIVFGSQRHP